MRRHRRGEPEDRTAADLAFEADPATHQVDQPGGDREAKPGAFVPARRRAVDLGELLEHVGQLVGRNADAGVLDTHLELDDAVDRLARDVDQHMALLGELHRIAEHVGDDLAEAPDIADDEGRQARIDADDKLEVLLRDTRRNQRGDVLDRLGEPERLGIERQLAGIYLGEIENVVDDGEQRIARLGDDVGEGLLARRELGLRQKLGHAEHAVHRRADLMAHIGKEFGLGAIGRLGLEQRLAGFGERVTDRLFHRPEYPQGNAGQHGEQDRARPGEQPAASPSAARRSASSASRARASMGCAKRSVWLRISR